jgi:hypothetical protein
VIDRRCFVKIFSVITDFAWSLGLVGVKHIDAEVAFARTRGREFTICNSFGITSDGIDVCAVWNIAECRTTADCDESV